MTNQEVTEMKGRMRDDYVKKHGEPEFITVSNNQKQKTIPYDLNEYLKDPEFKKEYDRLKPVADLTKLVLFSHLKNGWDGYDGIPPKDKTISNTVELLDILGDLISFNPNSKPFIGPSGDGEISIIWRNGDDMLDVGLKGDKTFSYYGKVKNQELFGNNDKIDFKINPNLINFIKKFNA